MQITHDARGPGSTIALVFSVFMLSFVFPSTGCWADFPDSRFLQDAETTPDTRPPDTRSPDGSRPDVGTGDAPLLDSDGDLSDSDLPKTDLSDGNLSDSDLSDGNLSDSDLPKTDLTKTDLPKTDLPKTDLPQADLPRADLPKTDLAMPDLPSPDTGVCTPRAFVLCINKKLLIRCNAAGDNVVSINCGKASCSTALQRCDECTPSMAPSCQGTNVQTCSTNGLYVTTTCPEGCLAGACCTNKDGDSASCDDCDDNDAQAFPGQTAYFARPRTSGGYDFDCDKVDTPQFPALVACAGSGANCHGDGWVGTVPACGQSGQFATCRKSPGACTQQAPSSRKQRCR